MSVVHILQVPQLARPWWATAERFEDSAGRKIWTDCCCCKVPSEETDCRLVTHWDMPLGGMGCYQYRPSPWDRTLSGRKTRRRWARPDWPTGAYYDATVEVRCADGFGCSANPRKKAGRSLREMWRSY